jgi:hypothetical protein
MALSYQSLFYPAFTNRDYWLVLPGARVGFEPTGKLADIVKPSPGRPRFILPTGHRWSNHSPSVLPTPPRALSSLRYATPLFWDRLQQGVATTLII